MSGYTDSGSDCGTGSSSVGGSGNFSGSVFGSGESIESGADADDRASGSRTRGTQKRPSRGLGFDERSNSQGNSRGFAKENFGGAATITSSFSSACSSNVSSLRAGDGGSGDCSSDSGSGSGRSGIMNFGIEADSGGVTLRRPRSAGSGSVSSASASGGEAGGSSIGSHRAQSGGSTFGEVGGSLLSAVETAEANKRLSFQEKRQFFESL